MRISYLVVDLSTLQDHERVVLFLNAVQSGDFKEVKGMLELTPELINEKDEDEDSALIAACLKGFYDIAHMLLEKGAHVDNADKHGNTALMSASKGGHETAAQLLLDKGASVDLKNQSGATALIIASTEGHISIVQLLLDHGADVNAVNNLWHSALTAACSQGHASIVELLLNKGANINRKNRNGYTALILASSAGHTYIAQLLLGKGASIKITDEDNNTALIWASNRGHDSIVCTLLNEGADVDIQNKFGVTALAYASKGGYTDIVKMLLEKGADTSIKDEDGKTALEVAKNDIIRQLLRSSAKSKSAFTIISARDVSISHRISSTGFSTVLRGSYRGTDVAIKMLRGDGAMEMSATDPQYREIEILSNLRHPRIVSLLGVILDLEDRYGAMAGLVTEYMPRGSLYDVLHLNTTPPEHRLSTLSSKLRVLRDVADGMRFLHMSNVIHRDLKSPNVLLDEDGRAKLCDFGISHILLPNISYATAAVGTPAWSSPESLMGEDGTVRPSSDVYSFGVILWEVLTNSIPWKGLSPFQIAARISRGESLPLYAVVSIVNTFPELITMLEKCLLRNPEHRPTFEHIEQCLSGILPACIEREERGFCPNAYLCPISYEIMEDPVICSDGHTYDRVNIEQWLQHNDTSPLTNMILNDKTLRPNIVLRGMIQEFKESNA